MADLVNHASYQPTPRDMLTALDAISQQIKKVTGKTPDVYVGGRKVYPPNAKKTMSEEAAKAAYSALSGEKGTITAKEGKEVLFKQTDGVVKVDNHQVEASIAPTSTKEVSAQTVQTTSETIEPKVFPGLDGDLVKEAVQTGPEKLPENFGISSAEGLTPEKVEAIGDRSLILSYGSADALREDLNDIYRRISDGMEYLKDEPFVKEMEGNYAQAVQSIEKRLGELTEQGQYQPPLTLSSTEQATNSETIIQNGSPVNELGVQPVPSEPAIVDQVQDPIQRQISINQQYQPDDQEIPNQGVDLSDNDMGHIVDESPVTDISDDLKAQAARDLSAEEMKFEPGPALGLQDALVAAQAEVEKLKATLESMNGQLEAMKSTLDALSSKESVPKLKEWSIKTAKAAVEKLQNRAKIDIVKVSKAAHQIGQKVLDAIGDAIGKKEAQLLKFDQINEAIATTIKEFAGGKDTLTEGDYSFNQKDDIYSVSHSERGLVYSSSDGGKFLGTTKDYNMLSKVKDAVSALTGPVAVVAQAVAKEAAKAVTQEVKSEGQRQGIKL
jgi:hypothetical protein